MAFGDRSGYARTDARYPRAFAVCSSCGTWWNRYRLIDQYEWAGDGLVNQELPQCPRCISKPQPQLRTVILPPDPRPINDPRPELPNDLLQNLNGFIQIVGPQPGTTPAQFIADFGGDFSPDFSPDFGGGGGSIVITGPGESLGPYRIATELDPTRPFITLVEFVTSLSTGWGLPVPMTTVGGSDFSGDFSPDFAGPGTVSTVSLTDRSGLTGISGVPVQLAPPNGARKYLVVYNRSAAPIALAQGQPIFGSPTTVIVGTGEALIQNTLRTPPTPIWRGAIQAMSLYPHMPFFAYEG